MLQGQWTGNFTGTNTGEAFDEVDPVAITMRGKRTSSTRQRKNCTRHWKGVFGKRVAQQLERAAVKRVRSKR